MCGQVGIIFGRRCRTKSELDYFKKVFAYLLFLSEDRGPHATGVAWLKCDGKYRILKRPQKSRVFLRDKSFRSFLSGIDSDVTWLAGHTRWQTVGDASNNHNNHPILAGSIIGTHNGTVLNANSLFARLKLPRTAQVDSELIFRLADTTTNNGCVNINAFKFRLALCRGEISAVMASKANPKDVVVIKGNRPLEIRYSKVHEAIVYSTDARYLNIVLAGNRGWKPVELHPMRIATFACDCLETSGCEAFELANLI